MICCGHILSDGLVGVVAIVAGVLRSRVPVMAFRLKSPNPPLLAASRSMKSTSLSLTVKLNFRARSTTTLPHLGRKRENISTNLSGDKTEQEIILIHKFSTGRISRKTKHLN